MATESIDTLVIGAGQAGIAMSEHLSQLSIPHLVLERDTIAHHWRHRRWDSLVANGPAWHDRFPNMEFKHCPADGFPDKEQVADYFVDYANMINAPIRTGVEVTNVSRNQQRSGFTITTSQGTLPPSTIEAQHVVVATGPFQTPVIPAIAPNSYTSSDTSNDKLVQIHSADYFRPSQLPEGGVLVVGAGSSGVQIADELNRAGRQVYLSVGAHDRLPRHYRGRDFVWWLGVLGLWDLEKMQPSKAHVTIAVSGAYGGQTIDFRRLAHEGITLVGLTERFTDASSNSTVHFANNLQDNIQAGDDYYLHILDEADEYVARNGLDLPEEPEARQLLADPDCLTNPIATLNLASAGIKTIIWATGYATDYRWLHVDAFDEAGKPQHQRGVSSEPGVYFLGLPWLSRRGSSFIWGVWHDAKHIAGHIATQNMYKDYRHPNDKET